MMNSDIASLYLGITLLISGSATFLGGLVYLIWLVIHKPCLI